MSNSTSAFLADRELSYYKGIQPAAPPATFYAALLSAVPTENDGTGLTEITGSSYARQPITAASGWSAITQSADLLHQEMSNANAIPFPAVTSAPYTVEGIALYDAAVGGDLWDYAAVASQAVAVGNQYVVAAGALKLQK